MLARGHLSALRPSSARRSAEDEPVEGSTWLIVPCKGRLSFLQQTLGRAVAHPEMQCCVVDYSCPDGTGTWVEGHFCREVAMGRLAVERVPGQVRFNKCRAHNAGARRAAAARAEYLCFLDADTLVHPGFHDFVRKNARPDRFLIAALRDDGSDLPSMTGLLVVSTAAFEQVGGFDEEFSGWGGEDIELRLRLFLLGGLTYGEVPLSLANPMPHGNNLRSQFYDDQNILSSNAANMRRIRDKLDREWAGHMLRSVEEADRLWYQRRKRATGTVDPDEPADATVEELIEYDAPRHHVTAWSSRRRS